MNKIIQLVFLFLVFSCHPDKLKKESIENLRFETTDASELFFKNVRRSDYDVEELTEARLEIFRYKNTRAETNLVTPALIVNWGVDRAFLMLETRDSLPETIHFLINDSISSDTILFDGSNQRQHAEVALKMYNAILDKQKIYVLLPGEWKKELFTNQGREEFRRIVFDFLRLVELR